MRAYGIEAGLRSFIIFNNIVIIHGSFIGLFSKPKQKKYVK